MKYLKLYEDIDYEYQRELSRIMILCNKYNIDNYTINDDGSIDVNGSVTVYNKGLDKLIIKFGNVSDSFYCSQNRLTSLEGCPKYVGGVFSCMRNRLTSLEGCPEYVGEFFDCSDNEITSFKGSPDKIHYGFSCSNNKIRSFEGCPSINGRFECDGNPIYHIWKLFTDCDKIELFNDYDIIRDDNIIILDRLNDFLEEIGKPTVTEVQNYKCI